MLKNPKLWMWISASTIIASTLIIVLIKPTWGIDFVGGSAMEIESASSNVAPIKELFSSQFQLSAATQVTGENTIIIRTPTLDDSTHKAIVQALQDKSLMQGKEISFSAVGPTIGKELRSKSIAAIAIVLVAMTIYLGYTFRTVSGLVAPWKFGLAAIYALVHDLFLVTACFVIFGKLWNVEIDVLFVTAQLAILGYSVNDTIVIFDRLRWEWLASRGKNLVEIIDKAITITLGRSLNTSLTTLLSLLAVLVFGGASVRWFIVALVIGVISGTYSSLYVAPPLLYYLAKRK